MRKFRVTLSKQFSATVDIDAESAEEAMDEACYQYLRGEIVLDGGYIYDGIQTAAEEVSSAGEQNLSESKKRGSSEMQGRSDNDDATPIARVVTPDKKEDF